VGQHHPRKIDILTLPTKLQQRQQSLVEHVTALDRGITIIENLGEESIDELEGPHVLLEEDQVLNFIVSLASSLCVNAAVLTDRRHPNTKSEYVPSRAGTSSRAAVRPSQRVSRIGNAKQRAG
jgi:hypothetical protein